MQEIQEDVGLIPESGRSPGIGNATPSSILVWKITLTEEPGRIQPMDLKESDTTDHTRAHTQSLYSVLLVSCCTAK